MGVKSSVFRSLRGIPEKEARIPARWQKCRLEHLEHREVLRSSHQTSMASTSSPPTPADPKAGSLSFFRKTACLFDWWLIKTESEFQGKRLGVAGSTSLSTSREKQQAVRVFSSAAIAKRFDVFTLETVDGVSVVLKGLINKQRTLDNGFPIEIFKDFVFGFPPNWENYAEKCCTGEDSTTVSGLENSPSAIKRSLEETPNKSEHVVHEDGEEEASEDQTHKVSENITIDSSQVSNLSVQHADEKKDKINVAPIGYRRCSQRLRNRTGEQEFPTSGCFPKDDCPTPGANTKTGDNKKLNSSFRETIQSGEKLDVSGNSPVHLSAKIRDQMKGRRIIVRGQKTVNNKLSSNTGKQEIPASSRSLKDETNVCPTSGANTKILDNKKLNSSSGGTIQSWRKQDMSRNSPVHLSAKIRNKTKEKRTRVCGLKTENNPVQNELGDGSMLVSPSNELQEPVDANMAEKLADGSIRDGPDCRQQSSKRQNPKNMNTKAVIETDARNKSTPRKRTKRKIIFEKQVSPQSPEEKEKTSIVSPECLTFRRSRSGRLLLPAMQFWRNQIPVYDLDRTIVKIRGDLPVRVPVRGSRSEPQKKRKR